MGSLATEALITKTFNVTKTDSLCEERLVAYLCSYYNVNALEYSMFNLPWIYFNNISHSYYIFANHLTLYRHVVSGCFPRFPCYGDKCP